MNASKHRADVEQLARVFWIHLVDVCSMFGRSCKRGIMHLTRKETQIPKDCHFSGLPCILYSFYISVIAYNAMRPRLCLPCGQVTNQVVCMYCIMMYRVDCSENAASRCYSVSICTRRSVGCKFSTVVQLLTAKTWSFSL